MWQLTSVSPLVNTLYREYCDAGLEEIRNAELYRKALKVEQKEHSVRRTDDLGKCLQQLFETHRRAELSIQISYSPGKEAPVG